MLSELVKKDKNEKMSLVDKVFLKTLFKNLFTDPCTVKYWDGDEEHYGEGESKFKIIFNGPIPKSEIMTSPSLVFGEAYMNRTLEIEGSVQDVIESLYNNKSSFLRDSDKYKKFLRLITNSKKNSKDNVSFHYDIGNDFYKLWLDETLTYSCGYFKSENDSLAQAQRNKVEHILKKLNLKKGQRLLDIGCGWGQLIITAAKEYGVKAKGITLSKEQMTEAKRKVKEEGLQDLVDIEISDYRELKNEKFDRIVSVGMIEHVGKEFLGEYFSSVYELLEEGGLSLLHCITGVKNGGTDAWINKYIFPGGYLPSVRELVDNICENDFYLTDVESLRRHYGRTLEHWAENFEKAMPKIEKMKEDSFIRMWRMYLNACAASFNTGNIDIHQFVFTKGLANEVPWTRDYIYR